MTAAEASKRDRILAERAERLAQAHDLDSAQAEGLEVVVFKVGEGEIAIPVEGLREVIELPRISGLPGTPAWILGIAQVRGELFAVVDLQRWMAREGEGVSRYLVLVEEGDRTVGLTVERVIGGRVLDPSLLGQGAGEGAGGSRVPIVGITPELIVVLDASEITRHEDLIV